MKLEEGTLIAGRYRLQRRLAEGGMGTVWVARHTTLDIECAVKLLQQEMAANPQSLARFEREARAAAQLKSPHVVQILDYGVFAGTPYIAMELLEGEDLRARLDRVGRLPAAETMAILDQVGRALGKAHAAGIVHRDLKPENVFLVQDREEGLLAKVLDFGVAKDFTCSRALTQRGMLLGTPAYMSPEQVEGSSVLDHRADLWSLAVVAYECITGVVPLRGLLPLEMAGAILCGTLPPPSSALADLPATLDGWWARATARDPSARFGSARELLSALAGALGRPPSLMPEPRAVPRGEPRRKDEGNATIAGMVRSSPPPKRRTERTMAVAAMVLAAPLLAVVAISRPTAINAPPSAARATLVAAPEPAAQATSAAAPAVDTNAPAATPPAPPSADATAEPAPPPAPSSSAAAPLKKPAPARLRKAPWRR